MRDPFGARVGGVLGAGIAVPEHGREVRFYSRVRSTGEKPLWREKDLMNNLGMPIIGLGARTGWWRICPPRTSNSRGAIRHRAARHHREPLRVYIEDSSRRGCARAGVANSRMATRPFVDHSMMWMSPAVTGCVRASSAGHGMPAQ
jgi:hypothetical protein